MLISGLLEVQVEHIMLTPRPPRVESTLGVSTPLSFQLLLESTSLSSPFFGFKLTQPATPYVVGSKMERRIGRALVQA